MVTVRVLVAVPVLVCEAERGTQGKTRGGC